ncbi:MAG: ABC transporter substrate-binding protein [Deltaproteobacteria bacterium]|nr:ABC transporter substrate-binding protein [Deltaproteobacteria bacterium]
MPREAVEKFGDLKRKAIGTGPFMLGDRMKGSHIILVRHPNYFKKGFPYLDKIHMKIMENVTVTMSAYLAGKLDIVTAQHFQVRTIKRKVPDTVFVRGKLLYNFHIRIPPWSDKRPLKPPFDNPKVRQAIAMAIDKQKLMKLAWGGYGTVQIGPVPNWPPYSLPEEDQVKYDPEQARKLLAEAGYPDGFSAEMISPSNPALTGGAQVAQAMLKAVGINVNLKILEFAQFFSRAWKFDYEMAYTSLTAGFDPEEYLVPYFGDTKKATYYKWNNKEIHRMIEEQRKILDPQKRARMIQEIQRKILKDAPMVFVCSLDVVGAFKPYVYPKRMFINPYAGETEDIWLDK